MAANRLRWLVTGGAGFFGIHMCRGLIERGQDVISYDIADLPANEKIEGVRAVQGDIRDADRIECELAEVGFVIHAAAALALKSAEEIDAVNAEGTHIVLEACAR